MKTIVVAATALALFGGAAHAETALEKTNKAVVLKFWSEVFDHHDWSKAKLYMDPGYIQHNPLAATGLSGFEAFFSKVWPKPLTDAEAKTTHFDVVMAEGDLVTLIQKIPRKDAAGQTYDSFWFDTLRVKNGKLVEHWDNAMKPGDTRAPSAL